MSDMNFNSSSGYRWVNVSVFRPEEDHPRRSPFKLANNLGNAIKCVSVILMLPSFHMTMQQLTYVKGVLPPKIYFTY